MKILLSRDERQFAKLRSRFGMTDAERRESNRREFVRGALLQAVAVVGLAMVVISILGGA